MDYTVETGVDETKISFSKSDKDAIKWAKDRNILIWHGVHYSISIYLSKETAALFILGF